MASIDQQFSEQFTRWEVRTRGRLVYPHPVPPEPPFTRFRGHFLTNAAEIDDGRRPTYLSSLLKGLWTSPVPSPPNTPEEEPELTKVEREPLVEFPLYLPESFNARGPEFENFTRSLYVCQQPIALELVGCPKHVTAQLAVSPEDSDHVRQQLRATFPELVATPRTGGLEAAWNEAGLVAGVLEFGLAKESVYLLGHAVHDPFVTMVGALSELSDGECGIFQVLWQPLQNPWADSILRAVADSSGKAFFVNAPELAGGAKQKTSRPLYAAVVRIAACSAGFERTWDILRRLASGLRAFANPTGNELVPLRNDHYPYDAHIEDLVRRQSRRAGMILNADELIGFVHLPSSAVRSSKFRRQLQKTKPAPAITTHPDGILLGTNEHAGEVRTVRLTREQRSRHMHLIGASGTGKTTLLYNLVRQDIESGEGVAVFDPHGDLIDRILGSIPSSRIDDVVLLDPSDEEFSIGFNILSAPHRLEKNLLASDLVSVFQRLSTSWGDQMGVVLNNAIRAFLESEKGGTLADLRRFLLEPGFRTRFLQTVRDPDIVYYWKMGFTQLSGNKSIGPVMTRLETFLSPKPIRYMVSQAQNRLDFGQILDTGKIFLAKLSQGAIGKENSYLLGSLLMAKFQQIAMSRQSQQESKRRDFWLYLDEFHNFITPSTAEILTGARKYHLGLALAHQELRQLQRDSEVASAVLANPYTRICFRVGDQDAKTLSSGFSSFEARDLQNLGTGQAVCRVERADYDFNLAVTAPEFPSEDEAAVRRREVIEASRAKYATSRAEVEAALRKLSEDPEPVTPPRGKPDSKDPPAPPTPPSRDPPPGPSSAPPPPPVPPPVPQATSTKTEPEPKPTVPVTDVVPASPPLTAETSGCGQMVNQPTEARRSAPETRQVVPSADLGRGGAQHKAVQLRIKDGATGLGFRVHTEKPILDGAGSVDLVLERDGHSLACEITVTTTIDHEIGNVSKCIKAGFLQIVVLALNEDKLGKLASAVRNSLGAESAARVKFFLPDGFLEYLRTISPTERPQPSTKRVRGYKVKTVYEDASPEEVKAKEDEMIKLMGEMMRKKDNPQ